jgi:hypothetical protein
MGSRCVDHSMSAEQNSSDQMSQWIWPSSDEINDFPDPLGFEAEWKPWTATMADSDGSELAEIFVRELVQNSWDSIQERTRGLSSDVTIDRGVEFHEVLLQGEDARAFVLEFGLDEHAARFAGMSDKHRKDSRLDDSTISRGDVDDLRLLVVNERWGKGMWGPWMTGGVAGVVSRLKSALIQTKSEKQDIASGGSWGHGKKGIANASTCRTLAVYTCSEPSANDYDDRGEPVTRRLLGVSYWRSHDLMERSHVGLGLLGNPSQTGGYVGFRPFENDEADLMVDVLGVPGFEKRNHAKPGETGVSYLIVEPSFDIQQLAKAVSRNWWPLLLSNPDAVKVFDQQGMQLPCDPREWPELAPFVESFWLATGMATPNDRAQHATTLSDQAFGEVGCLGLTSDATEDGWSFHDPDTNASLVALVRNDMVIAYQQFPLKQRGKAPFVRGAFVVDRSRHAKASEGLKMSEPHLHNEWITRPSPSVPKEYADFASRTLNKVATCVSELKNKLRDDTASDRIRFDAFSNIWSEGSSVGRSGSDDDRPKRSRDFSIQYEDQEIDVDVHDPTQLRMTCTVVISLLPRPAAATAVAASVDLGWGVLEERGPVRDARLTDPTTELAPPGFRHEEGRYIGLVSSTPVRFSWTSGFFPDDWQVVPDPQVERVDPEVERVDTLVAEVVS